MITSRSLIDAGRLVVVGEKFMPIRESYWLVYPPRSQEHRGLQVFREWLLAEAQDYCRECLACAQTGRPPELSRCDHADASSPLALLPEPTT